MLTLSEQEASEVQLLKCEEGHRSLDQRVSNIDQGDERWLFQVSTRLSIATTEPHAEVKPCKWRCPFSQEVVGQIHFTETVNDIRPENLLRVLGVSVVNL